MTCSEKPPQPASTKQRPKQPYEMKGLHWKRQEGLGSGCLPARLDHLANAEKGFARLEW